MRFLLTALPAACLVLLLPACAGSSARSGSQPRASRNVITGEQLQQLQVHSVYEAVIRMRSHWLRTRSVSINAPNPIQVYVDGIHMGDVEYLKRRSTDGISRVVFIGAADATTRWGTGHSAGVIEIITRQRSP